MAHLGPCWPILTPSWARSDGLAGLSWGPWALLWAKFGWFLEAGGENRVMLWKIKKIGKNTGKTQEISPNIGPSCAPGSPRSRVGQRPRVIQGLMLA